MDGLSCAAGDDGCLYIGDVVHTAFVSVDESGTEAAAATAVMMQTESAKPIPVEVKVDRPFIFVIRDPRDGDEPVRGPGGEAMILGAGHIRSASVRRSGVVLLVWTLAIFWLVY